MVVADLHVHTPNSDGTLALADVPRAARNAGLAAVAVTDHDRLHPVLSVPVTRREGVTLVHGIELRVASPVGRVDLLGYGVSETPALRALIDRVQADRVDRGRRMIECLEDRLDVDLAVRPRPGLGRPHVARAVAEATDLDYQAVFDRLLGNDRPCYVARDVPSFETGRDVLGEACGLVGLAHPLRYDDVAGALGLAADLDAVELHYPYDREVDREAVERAVAAHDLVVTGGSDAHDDALGRAGLDRAAYRRFRSRLALP